MANPIWYDRSKQTSTTTGTGTFTLSAASGSFQNLNTTGSTLDVCYAIVHQTAAEWEVGIGQVNSASTTLTRTTSASSNGGGTVSFSAGTKDVFTTMSAALTPRIGPNTCEGRLTLTSGSPVPTSDVSSSTNVYYTPYLGNQIALQDSNLSPSPWRLYDFSETTLAIGTVTANLPYDIFGYSSAGALTLEKVAWTNSTTRATSLTTTDGVLTKSGQTYKRYLGTFYSTSTTQTADTARQRLLFNYYNRVPRILRRIESTDSWSYTTATWRQVNTSTSNQVEVMVGYADLPVDLVACSLASNTGNNVRCAIGIGEDSTSAPDSNCIGLVFRLSAASAPNSGMTYLVKYPAVGYHYYAWLEWSAASGTTTWYGDNADNTLYQAGITGVINI